MGDVTVNVQENGAPPPEVAPAGYTLQLMQGTTADTSTVPGNVGTILETLVANTGNLGTLIFQSALTPGLLYNMCEPVPATAPPTVTWSPGTSYFSGGQMLSCVDFTAQVGTTVMITANNKPQGTNSVPSTIVVSEVTSPATNSQIFTFTSNYGSPFNLSTGQSNTTSVTPASYPANFSVSETSIGGYLTNGTCTVGTTTGISPSSIVLTAAGQQANCTFTNTSLPPVVTSVTGPTLPQAMGTVVPVTATFSDQFLFTHTCTLAWGDTTVTAGTVTESTASTPGKCSGSHTYTTSAVYSVLATVTSPYGSGSASSAPFPVYDPNGSIKGNARIWSHPFPGVTTTQEKARVSFTAKNDNGIPKGNLVFKLGKFQLKSTSYSSVVILLSNLTATVTGSGIVKTHTAACDDDCDDNDDRHFSVVSTTYTFQLDTKDGDMVNTGNSDALRFRMWQAGTLVYDSDSTGTGQLSPVVEGKIEIKP